MIWLVGLALAGPCDREIVLARGLDVMPSANASVLANLELDLWVRKRRIDGIPAYFVHKAAFSWRWKVTAENDNVVRSSVGVVYCLFQRRRRW